MPATKPTLVRGADVQVGDLLVVAGKAHHITRIEPYEGTVLAELLGPWARTAYEDGPEPWSITLDGSRHPGYEVVR